MTLIQALYEAPIAIAYYEYTDGRKMMIKAEEYRPGLVFVTRQTLDQAGLPASATYLSEDPILQSYDWKPL